MAAYHYNPGIKPIATLGTIRQRALTLFLLMIRSIVPAMAEILPERTAFPAAVSKNGRTAAFVAIFAVPSLATLYAPVSTTFVVIFAVPSLATL